MGNTATVTTGAGAYGGASAGTILLNMWMKHHGYAPLQPEEALAVMTVVGPAFHTGLLVLSAIIKALLRKLGITVLDDVPSPTLQG